MEENKIMDNQEQKDIKLENSSNNDNGNNANKNKTYNKGRIIILVVVILLCITITTLLIFLKINKLNKITTDTDRENIKEETDINKERPSQTEPDDLKYAINSLSDKYDENDLYIEEIVDGKITYVQISGLKNITIQNNINNEIKSLAYDVAAKNADGYASAKVMASFSNVLSVRIDYIGLNYDLNTGEKITIDKLFVSSAPLGLIISNSAYQAYADSKASFNEGIADMSNVDLSEFEEEVISTINQYNKNKESINFWFSVEQLFFYGEDGWAGTIYLSDYKEYIAIFKRYAGKDIFVDNDIGVNDIFVFTDSINRYYGLLSGKRNNTVLAYGKINDNLFVDIGTLPLKPNIKIDDNVYKKIRNDVETKINSIYNEEKEKARSNKNVGYVLQCLLSSISYNDENSKFVSVYIEIAGLELDREFFDSNLNETLINAYKFSLSYPASDGVFLGNALSVNGPYKDKVINRNFEIIKLYYNVEDGSYFTDNYDVVKLYSKNTSELDGDIKQFLSKDGKRQVSFARLADGNKSEIEDKLISSYFQFISGFLAPMSSLRESIDVKTSYKEFLDFKVSENNYCITVKIDDKTMYIKWDRLRNKNIYVIIYNEIIKDNIVYNIKLKDDGEKIFSELFDKYNK